MIKLIGAIAPLLLLASAQVSSASDDFQDVVNMIEIGANDSLTVPVKAGAPETIELTPVMIEKDEAGHVVGIRSVLGDRDIGYFFALQYGRPLRVSVSAGLIIGTYDQASGVHGLLVEGAVGQGGLAGTIGWGSAGDQSSSMGVTVLRTFGNSWGAMPGSTYAGIKQVFSVYSIQIAAGFLYRVGGPEGSRWLTTFGAGIVYGDLIGGGGERARKNHR